MTESNQPITFSPGLTAAVALVVSVLAALGVSGNFLVRAVRDQPWIMSYILSAALLAVAFLIINSAKSLSVFAATLLLLATLITTVFYGSNSIAQREQPRVVMSAEPAETGMIKLSIDASGSGLRTSDDLTVQVIGLNYLTSVDGARPVCEDYNRANKPPGLPESRLLAWERSGPDSEGNVKLSFKVNIPTDQFKIICAWTASALNRKGPSRTGAAYLILASQRGE